MVSVQSGQNYNLGTGGQSVTVTHQYQLQPTRVGKLNVGPFSYQLNGKNFDLPAVEVEVVAQKGTGGQADSLSNLVFATVGVITVTQSVMVSEKQLGTMAWLLTKPISRAAVVLSKLKPEPRMFLPR